MDSRDSLAAVLRVLRRARERKAEHFSEGINPTHIANLENGKVSVTLHTLEAVANVLDIKPVTLLVLATALRNDVSSDSVLREIELELKEVASLGVEGELADEFEDGKLRSRPSGAQISQERFEAVLACKASGLTQKETAQKLGIPSSTVQRYWQKG